MTEDSMVVLDTDRLEAMLERAAKRGARDALESIGMHDHNALKDVQELRGLLDAWRGTKNTIWKTVTQAFTMIILGALSVGLFIKIKGG